MPPQDPTPADSEGAVQAAVHEILHDWVDSSPESIERFLGAVVPSFTGYGTGPGDYYSDAVELRAMVEREHAGMSYPFSLAVPWMSVRRLNPTAAVAVGEIAVTIEVEGETVVETPRFTFVLVLRGGRWMLAHFHFSVPDAMQHEGGTMDDLLSERTRQLEAEVARRTADLEAAQAQLVQQEKMASLGALTAGIAHEIKNPLNFVTNFAGLAREAVGDLRAALAAADADEVEALLGDLALNTEKIEAHGRRADGIVRAMMAHARSGSGERRAVDVNALVEEYVAHAVHGKRARNPEFGVRVALDLDPEAGHVEAVPQEIGRVVVNLVDNALDAVRQRAASETGSYVPAVTVATRRLGDRVAVRVADNGPGVAEAVRARIFEPFFTTKPTGQGTGLGLSLSHDIVTQGHRGTLSVESEEGDGAAFVMTLPRTEDGG